MAAPLITAITTVPNRENATNQASFSNDVDTFFSQVDGFQTQANAQAQYLDGVAAEVDASEAAAAASALEASGYASTTIDARDAAIASAVYKGTWEGKTSAGVIGESYSYQGSYIYRLNVNLANISTSEPSQTNTDWQLINVVPFEAPCKATLDLDFANQDFTIYDKLGGFVKRPLADLVSQGRATAGTSKDAIGGITEFAAGENRFTFDGETGEALGYLSEESRTNLLTNSEFPNGLSDLSLKGDLVTLSSMSIGGSNINAVRVEIDTELQLAYKSFATTAGVTYTFSVFMEMEDGGAPVFANDIRSSPDNDFGIAINGRGVDGVSNYKIKKSYGSTYIVSCTYTAIDSNPNVGLIKFPTNSPRTFKVTGYQLEVGSFPTSYIRTLGAPVTRAADSMAHTLGQEWNPNEGTFVVELGADLSKNQIFFEVREDSANYIYLGYRADVQVCNLLYRATNGTPLNKSFPYSDRIIISYSYREGVIRVSTADGFSTSDPLSGNFDANTLSVGCIATGTGATLATFREFQYYPRAFDSITLQRLSRIQ